MRILDLLLDVGAFVFQKLKDIFLFLLDIALQLLSHLYNKFLEVRLPEKVVYINTFLAFLAVVLPVAKFYIFESWFYVNNPLAVYMIGIAMVMFGSLYVSGLYVFIARIVLNSYYLVWVIYIPLAEGLTRANPHWIIFGYFLNIAVPVIYILAGLWSYFDER
ncbi:MAG TPA: hypothetical protein PK544_12770 [Spirochaetota bacterium]|nr:hypothetical protein [Spirochaetota bacterium]HPJ39034.1 hypothetical protein [Spirochaetota bacterium]HPQ53254.1 hypothetical protein [Spirochaetota bacterium]